MGMLLSVLYRAGVTGPLRENSNKNHPFSRGERSHKETRAGCIVSSTTATKSPLKAFRSVFS
jgi:hypothetical protein